MLKRAAYCVLVIGFMTSVSCPTRARSSDYKARFVDHPFVPANRLANFVRRFGDSISLDDDFLKNAGLIKTYGYQFDLTPCSINNSCAKGDISAIGHRITVIDMKMAEEQIMLAVAGARRTGCSYVNVSDPRRDVITDNFAIYSIEVSARKRWCDNVLGSYEIARVDATLRVFLTLTKSAVEIKDGQSGIAINVTQNTTVTKKKLLSFFDADDLMGQILGIFINVGSIVLEIFNSNELKMPRLEVSEARQIISEFVKIFHGSAAAYSNYSHEIEGLRLIQRPYSLNIDKTKLGVDDLGRLQITIVSDAKIGVPLISYYNIKADELDMLESLGESYRKYSVMRGDSLWSICKKEYGDGFLYNYIRSSWAYSNVNTILKPGTIIDLPPYYQIYGIVKKMIKPGDSLWSLWVNNSGGLSWSSFIEQQRKRRRNINSIYPLEIL